MLKVHKVSGTSMMPYFRPDQHVFSLQTKKIKPNDVVVFKYKNENFIKRVRAVSKDFFNVVSDNQNYPSEVTEINLDKKFLIGKVIFKW